jgi:hypothetical protein
MNRPSVHQDQPYQAAAPAISTAAATNMGRFGTRLGVHNRLSNMPSLAELVPCIAVVL